MGEKGVSARESAKETGGRDSAGRFLPGVVNKSPGHPTKAQELAILDSIRSTFPPDVVAEHLRTAMRLATEQNSARGIVAVLEFAAGYTLGRPIQRVITTEGGLADMAEELGIDLSED